METQDNTSGLAPDLDIIEALALSAIDALPQEFRHHARAVQLRVAELAPDDMLSDLRIKDPFELTGLYDGIPLTEKSLGDIADRPDTIWLFRRAILDEWVARGNVDLRDLVSHVLVHELAHHFGWTDDDIARIDRWWE